MGKRRNTAKTGDKAIYKARSAAVTTVDDEDDDDPMFTKVDRFHQEREEEFLKLDDAPEESSDDNQVEAVMDLGIGGGDESESSGEDDSSSDEENRTSERELEEASSEEEQDLDLSDSDNEEFEMEDVRDWGKKKSAYYHGDTADLEIGQDAEDASLEEEAVKEGLASRYEDMSEDDFMLSDAEEDKKESEGTVENLLATRDISKLSSKDRLKILEKRHSEMLPLISYFSQVVNELETNTIVATRAIFEGEEGTAEAIGTTKAGKRYLLTKALLQSSTALNLVMYLLLKTDQPSEEVDSTLIQSHPVMARLQKLNALAQRLENEVEQQVPGLSVQLSNLVKAAALVNSGEVPESDSEGEDSDNGPEEVDTMENQESSPEVALSESDDELDAAAEEQRVLNEARFGLRPSELVSSRAKPRRRPMPLEFGDDSAADAQKASRSLASTLNTIEQKTHSQKQRAAPMADQIDDTIESHDELDRGLAMMEEELGKDFDKNDEFDGGTNHDEELDSEEDDGFYAQVSQKSKSHKDFKKNLYAVAPKFPRVEREIEGERAINKTILKNRGLVAHKSRLNRNPRVKKREQYRKALIRRKGAIRQVRTDEGHKYGGETTGIKSGVSRSRKLGR